MAIRFVKQKTHEWDFMWEELGKLDMNKNYKDPTICESNGEVWKYIETVWNGHIWMHGFRHRKHPYYDGLDVYLNVNVSPEFIKNYKEQSLTPIEVEAYYKKLNK